MKTLGIESKKCLECGVMFFKKPSESRKYWRTKKYCSYKCSLIYTAVQKQDQSNNPSLMGHLIPWNKDLKGIHLSPKSEFKKGQRGYWTGKERLDIRGRKKIAKTICFYCEKELILQPNQIRNRNFCNRECWGFGHRGTNSPVYRGEKSVARLRNRVAQLPEYKDWHATCLKNGNYLCFKCGTKKQLEVDHIKRFFIIVVENGIITPEDARNCKELWNVKNGRVICRPCHRTLDTYGTKGLKKINKTSTNKMSTNGTNLFTQSSISTNVKVGLADVNGNAVLCTGTTPTAVAGYAVGCILIDTTTGISWSNTGTAASCTFVKVSST